MTVEQFRAEQVIWGGFGLAAALLLAVLQLLGDGASPISLLGAAVAFTVGGVLAHGQVGKEAPRTPPAEQALALVTEAARRTA
ncbi:MAG: hypothetical protein KY393_07850 [Actinobacteria bacterium]|nr:hypothetical protein [Actinomycetota bacterium]